MEVIVGMYRVMAVALVLTVMTLVFTYFLSAAVSMGLDIVHLGIQLARDTLSASPESP